MVCSSGLLACVQTLCACAEVRAHACGVAIAGCQALWDACRGHSGSAELVG